MVPAMGRNVTQEVLSMSHDPKHTPGKVGTIGGIVIAFIGSAPGWIGLFYEHGNEMISTISPVASVIWPFLLLAIGIFVGWKAHVWHEAIKAEKSRIEPGRAVAVAAKAQRYDNLKKTYRAMEFHVKEFIYTIYVQGSFTIPREAFLNSSWNSIAEFTDAEKVRDGTKYTLKENVRAMFDEDENLFDSVKEAN